MKFQLDINRGAAKYIIDAAFISARVLVTLIPIFSIKRRHTTRGRCVSPAAQPLNKYAHNNHHITIVCGVTQASVAVVRRVRERESG